MAVGLPEPQLPADLFRDVDLADASAEQLGVFTSKWLLRRASGYAKRLSTAESQARGGGLRCENGCSSAGGACGVGSTAPSATSLPPDFRGKTVLVLGAGDTAMDCATAALRCGAIRVRVVFRRGTPDVRAVPEELEGAMRERCELVPHSQPVRFLFRKPVAGNGIRRIRAVQFRRTDTGDLDPQGSVDDDDDDDLFVLRADCVVSAFGSRLPAEGESFVRTKLSIGSSGIFRQSFCHGRSRRRDRRTTNVRNRIEKKNWKLKLRKTTEAGGLAIH